MALELKPIAVKIKNGMAEWFRNNKIAYNMAIFDYDTSFYFAAMSDEDLVALKLQFDNPIIRPMTEEEIRTTDFIFGVKISA